MKWYNEIGYGFGDIAGNVVYAFLTFFVVIYLIDTVGLSPGIADTLMAVARIFDCALVTFLLTKLNVEKANQKLLAER